MRRFFIVLVLCIVAVSASASYKIFLTTGDTILADDKPQVKDGTASFIRGGLTYTIPASRIDFEKSEKTALLEASGPKIEQFLGTDRPAAKSTKPVPVMKVDDESLDKIRQRSRLANEGELSTPEPGGPNEGAKPGEEGRREASPSSTHEQAQEKVRLLEQSLAQAESERNQMRNDAQDLKQRYDSSIQQEDKTALWSQYESARESLEEATRKVNDTSAQLSGARDDLNSKALVVELPQAPQNK